MTFLDWSIHPYSQSDTRRRKKNPKATILHVHSKQSKDKHHFEAQESQSPTLRTGSLLGSIYCACIVHAITEPRAANRDIRMCLHTPCIYPRYIGRVEIRFRLWSIARRLADRQDKVCMSLLIPKWWELGLEPLLGRRRWDRIRGCLGHKGKPRAVEGWGLRR